MGALTKIRWDLSKCLKIFIWIKRYFTVKICFQTFDSYFSSEEFYCQGISPVGQKGQTGFCSKLYITGSQESACRKIFFCSDIQFMYCRFWAILWICWRNHTPSIIYRFCFQFLVCLILFFSFFFKTVTLMKYQIVSLKSFPKTKFS